MSIKPTFAPGYVAPGMYIKQQDISTPNVPGGARIPAPIGQGNKTLSRVQKLVRGVKNGQDGPLTQNVVIDILSVIDTNNVVYVKGVDYLLTRLSPTQAMVDWSPKASLVGTVDLLTLTYPGDLDGLILHLTVDGGSVNPLDQIVTFTLPANPADVVNQINTWSASLAGVASLDANNHLVISANSIIIEEGNANTLLGFITGQSASVQEPATGVSYQVTYTSDKTDDEYKPQLFSNMNDVISYYGSLLQATQLYSGTPTAVGATVLTDGTKSFVTNSLRGAYIKIVGGPGKGQVRVITDNNASQVTVSVAWNTSALPDVSSQYSITDVNQNTISMGSQCMSDGGAAFFIGSQYKDDLFDSSNIKLAIDNLKEDIKGVRPEYLVLMRGIGLNEVGIITYLKTHVTTMSNELNNKFRAVGIGLAMGIDNFADIQNLANPGILNRRVDLMNITTIQKDFGTGQGVLNLDGSFVAAGYAGVYCDAQVDAAEPITRKSMGQIFDVDTFSDPFLEQEKNSMASAGVTIIERQGADIRIRHALSTDTTTIFTAESKLRRSADYISNLLKTSLENTLTGRRFVVSAVGSNDVILLAKTSLIFLLDALKNPLQQTITEYQNVSVKQNQVVKQQLDIQADIFLTTDVVWTFALLGFKV